MNVDLLLAMDKVDGAQTFYFANLQDLFTFEEGGHDSLCDR